MSLPGKILGLVSILIGIFLCGVECAIVLSAYEIATLIGVAIGLSTVAISGLSVVLLVLVGSLVVFILIAIIASFYVGIALIMDK